MRTILHCDLNNFYASAELLSRPDLRDLPVAVTGDPEKRHGIILAKNGLAKAAGIQTGETIWKARMKCPNLVCLPPHYDDYVRLSDRVFEIYTEYTDRVEAFGPDECWLDVTESRLLFGDGRQIADTIRERVKRETGLTLSAGVSWNKIFAKLGSDLKKPDATSVITHENLESTVYPLPVGELFLVGRATAEKLDALNIRTIGDLARTEESVLKRRFGIVGTKLLRYARGEDDEPVRKYFEKRIPESVGHGITASRDLNSYEDLRVVTLYLCDRIAKRLRAKGLAATRVAVDLRDCELEHRTRQAPLDAPTDDPTALGERATELIRASFVPGRDAPIRTLTIGSYGLESYGSACQMNFFSGDPERGHRLGAALDRIDRRYGKHAVERALVLGRDFIYDKHDSEDFLPFKR